MSPGFSLSINENVHFSSKNLAMPDESIYDEEGRLAQPDEVWNYSRGDGVEKAVLLANILRRKRPGEEFQIRVSPDQVFLEGAGHDVTFQSNKGLNESLWSFPPYSD